MNALDTSRSHVSVLIRREMFLLDSDLPPPFVLAIQYAFIFSRFFFDHRTNFPPLVESV